MEITIAEILLFAWAALATGAAFKYREDEERARYFLKMLIENEKARDQMVGAYEEFKKKVEAL
jgi:hypothetical protein